MVDAAKNHEIYHQRVPAKAYRRFGSEEKAWRRTVVMGRMLLFAVGAASLAGCGLGGGGGTRVTTTSALAPSTTMSALAPSTTTGRQASIEARPPSGPLGTSFQLLGSKFQPGEKVAFEIDLPDGKTFKGQPHTATADGSVNAAYNTAAANPTGTYKLKATGDRGTKAIGTFMVTSPGSATTVPARASTTKKP